MEIVLKIFGCLFLTHLLFVITSAKDWRGIVPFHSNRTDVERLFGKPPTQPSVGTVYHTLNKGRSIYILDEGVIVIVYANDQVPAALKCLGSILLDTVLMVQVEPEKAIRISDLQIDEKRFRKFKPPDPRNIGFEGYIDQEDGLVIRTREGLIDRINYVAAKQDRHLCPTYADEPEEVVMQIVEPPPPYCPTSVQLSCPKGEVVAGSLVTTSVIFEDLDPALKLSYDWTVSGGMIKSGQGTDTVVVNANGLEGQLLKVAVKIGGLDVVCVSYLTCEMRITKRRKG